MGYPNVSVSWSKDSVPVPECPGDRVCVSGDDGVYIAAATLEDAGIYTCVMSHSNQLINHTAVVSVRPRLSKGRSQNVMEIYTYKWIH